MSWWSPEAARERDYRDEMEQTLGAQNQVMRGLYNREARWSPAWSSLAFQNQNNWLWGGPEQTFTVDGKSVTVPATGGLMQMYSRLVPELQQYMTDPETAALLEKMTTDAGNELDLGTSLDPTQMRLVQQSVRAGQAARGMGYGPSDVYGEALGASQYGQDLRRERRAYAGDVARLRQSIYGTALPTASNVLGISSGIGGNAGPQFFNPESAYAGNLYASNVANDWMRKQIAGSGLQKAAVISDTIANFVGGVGKGAGGFAMACYVAREVYGAYNPQWVEFRNWLYRKAPAWFRRFYEQHGQAVARWLKNKPRLKRAVRAWMDRRIASMEEKVW